MIEMTTIDGNGYSIDIIARIRVDDSEERRQGFQPEVLASRRIGELTDLIEEAL